MLELTIADFQELEAKAQACGEQLHQMLALGFQHNLSRQLGMGGDRTLPLRNGLSRYIRKGVLSQSIRHVRHHQPRFPLVAKFYLSDLRGGYNSRTAGVSR